jgi:hypothetical protein
MGLQTFGSVSNSLTSKTVTANASRRALRQREWRERAGNADGVTANDDGAGGGAPVPR